MTLQDELLEIERTLWTGGPEAYRRHLSAECLLALTGMTGVVSNEQVASSMGDSPRWEDPQIEVKGLVRPASNVAILTYAAKAKRRSGESYAALVSSGYARTDEGWQLVFHQQTESAQEAS